MLATVTVGDDDSVWCSPLVCLYPWSPSWHLSFTTSPRSPIVLYVMLLVREHHLPFRTRYLGPYVIADQHIHLRPFGCFLRCPFRRYHRLHVILCFRGERSSPRPTDFARAACITAMFHWTGAVVAWNSCSLFLARVTLSAASPLSTQPLFVRVLRTMCRFPVHPEFRGLSTCG